MIILFFVFSLIAIAVAFYSYRVFKAMAMGQIGAGGPNGGMFMRGMNGGANNNDDDEAPR